MKRFRILMVVGARPNYMKAAPIYGELIKNKRFYPLIVHTGQHYDREMSEVFFRDLGLARPRVDLGVGSASHAVQTARIMERFEPVCRKHRPDLVLVAGDVNSTIACSLTAVKLGIRVGHVEAGLRSFDRSMPEEINRLLTDQISDYLFTTCADARRNLLREGIDPKKIFFVGNTMIDSLLGLRAKSKGQRAYRKYGLKRKAYCLVTLHRPSNVDDARTLRGIWRALEAIAKKMPVIFPVHPRTSSRISAWGIGQRDGRLILTRPLGYAEFMSLMADAALVLTDSGGIQEETTILAVPCLTLRHNTERPITVTQGTNKLVGTDPEKIIKEAGRIIKACQGSRTGAGRAGYRTAAARRRPKFWDGRAAKRLASVLEKIFAGRMK